jgi:DNA-binding NarL/FixJ family response regulator
MMIFIDEYVTEITVQPAAGTFALPARRYRLSTSSLSNVDESKSLQHEIAVVDFFAMKRATPRASKVDRAVRWYGHLNCDALTPREVDVLALTARGLTNKQIAHQLKLAEGTVKIHLHRIYRKLGIKSRFALAVLARNAPSKGPE